MDSLNGLEIISRQAAFGETITEREAQVGVVAEEPDRRDLRVLHSLLQDTRALDLGLPVGDSPEIINWM